MQQKIKVVYILGHSRSGSTLLGFHLGELQHTFFAGEIKRYGQRVFERKCTCGEDTLDCKFWNKFINSNEKYFTMASRNDNILRKSISNFKYILFGPSKHSIKIENTLLQNLHSHANHEGFKSDYIIDSSKSLNRLIVLKAIPEIDVYTLYLTRDIRHNLASFVKRKQHMMLHYLKLRVNDKLINWYLKQRSDRHFRVSYEEFIADPEGITEKICSFAEMNESSKKPSTNLNYHVITGSSNTRKAYRENPTVEIANRNIDEPFSELQKKILSFLGL